MKTVIVRIVGGFERWEWLCRRHLTQVKAVPGNVVTVSKPPSEERLCDRCDLERQNGNVSQE